MQKMNRLFITGIGTDVGKTIAAAILVEAMGADYWKPIQAGELHHTDTMKVKELVTNPISVFHPEAYRLAKPMSPHAAAAEEGITINLESINPPPANNTLIIEGAGGLMVPLNDDVLIIDLIQKLQAQAVLVSRNYLGSINHTLLSAEALLSRNIPVAGIIFNGKPTPSSEEYILKRTGLKRLFNIKEEKQITPQIILQYSEVIKQRWINTDFP